MMWLMKNFFVLWLEASCSVTYTNMLLLLLLFLLRSGVWPFIRLKFRNSHGEIPILTLNIHFAEHDDREDAGQ
jgi:hypothetical protein